MALGGFWDTAKDVAFTPTEKLINYDELGFFPKGELKLESELEDGEEEEPEVPPPGDFF